MQTIQLKTCNNCQPAELFLERMDRKIWQLSETSLQRLKYNVETPLSRGEVKDLLYLKRIVQKRMQNPAYPGGCITAQELASVIEPLLYSQKKCLCLSEPPSQ